MQCRGEHQKGAGELAGQGGHEGSELNAHSPLSTMQKIKAVLYKYQGNMAR